MWHTSDFSRTIYDSVKKSWKQYSVDRDSCTEASNASHWLLGCTSSASDSESRNSYFWSSENRQWQQACFLAYLKGPMGTCTVSPSVDSVVRLVNPTCLVNPICFVNPICLVNPTCLVNPICRAHSIRVPESPVAGRQTSNGGPPRTTASVDSVYKGLVNSKPWTLSPTCPRRTNVACLPPIHWWWHGDSETMSSFQGLGRKKEIDSDF